MVGRNLRADLLHAVDDITSAMSVLVDELSKGKQNFVFFCNHFFPAWYRLESP